MGLVRKRPAAASAKSKPASATSKHKTKSRAGPQSRGGHGLTPQPSDFSVGKQALVFGCRRRPSKIVVLLHGLNDSAKCCAQGVANRWASGLPKALIALPQSPHRTSWSNDADPGYTWTPVSGLLPYEARERHGSESPEFRASIQEFHKSVRKSSRMLNRWLDAMLDKYNLTDNDLVLTGFSQGSILAAIVGAKRHARGVIVCGGVPLVRSLELAKLMPQKSRMNVLAVNGTKDTLVQRRPLVAMLAPYESEWHWSQGVGHDFPSRWIMIYFARAPLKVTGWLAGAFCNPFSDGLQPNNGLKAGENHWTKTRASQACHAFQPKNDLQVPGANHS